jgi:outer membrane protein assembly factor BamB
MSKAGDWPMWRYDAGRTAASPDPLPDKLQLLWTREGTPRIQAWDDPLNLDLMTYDRLFEPIVMNGRMFVGHSDSDKLLAIDIETGRELWAVYADGPVRLPPAGWKDSVFFTSDDGQLYCVDAQTGTTRWQFAGAPGPRKVVGNHRLISAWPARGGVVIRDGRVYFASSIWPFMGVFIYALDAETGAVEWVNDSAGSTYIKQPHSAPSFAGVGPQGALAATQDDLIVPGGRSVPAVFNRKTGELRYFELNAGGKGSGGSFVVADDSVFYVHTRLKGVREFNLPKGDKTAFQPNEPVLHGNHVYSAETTKEGESVVRAYNRERAVVWEVTADGRGDLILAGNTLYAAGPNGLSAVTLSAADENEKPSVIWSTKTDGQIERLLAADEKLFAVTREGNILAYGEASPTSTTEPAPRIAVTTTPLQVSEKTSQPAAQLLATGDAQGFSLWFGAADDSVIDAVAAKSPFIQLAIVDHDADRVQSLRRRLDSAGLLGRITAHQGTVVSFDASPYLCQMIFVGSDLAPLLAADQAALAKAWDSVRPYGGVLQFLATGANRQEIASRISAAGLERAEVALTEYSVVVRRVGALPGSADWTHLHGDIANTRKSNDSRVKLPLGILWFGGSSHMDVLPRHGHGPPQQVVDGRLFIQGINKLSARDVYTGRVLWIRDFKDLGTYDVYYDQTYKETPLDPAYNQVHIPGANARGTNYVVTPDRIYILEGAACLVLDPKTGETIQTIELPQEDPTNPQEWSYIGIYEDVLIGGLGFAKYRDRLNLSFAEEDEKIKGNKAGFGSKSFDRAGSRALIGFDRITGRQLWKVDARHSFWNNAIVAGRGKIYCLDRNPRIIEEKLARRGIPAPATYRLLALDAHTGDPQWQVEEGIFGTWLGYSDQHDLLLQAGAAASDRLVGETDKGMTVYHGVDGSVVWTKPELKYSGPCILHNDLIITNANSYNESAGAYYLSTGEPQFITNPLTGEKSPWKISRTYGCNTILASENMLTFRSGAAGFYDLKTHSGTGNFGGFKSGCTGNLIAAGGVLNAPDYTRTCSCSYQNQTSLAMVHMPEIETWTVNSLSSIDGKKRPIETLGINFGAPGQRRDAAGTMWVEWPGAAHEVSPLNIAVNEPVRFFKRHSSAISGTETPWIFASGLEGAAEIRIDMTIEGKSRPKEGEPAQDAPQTVPEPTSVAAAEPVPYAVRLFFGAPAGRPETGERIFDVLMDDVPVLTDVRIDGESQVHELPATKIGESFRLRLVAKVGVPVLSGIELRRIRP